MSTGNHAYVRAYIAESLQTLVAFEADRNAQAIMLAMADTVVSALRAGGKLMVAGNGGSAGDAQHIAGEFVSRLMYDRGPLPAIALTVDTSVITAVGNDYGYEFIFERQVLALGQEGDVLLGISTSGKSRNVIRALDAAREGGVVSIGFTGADGGPMREKCRHLLEAPSSKTAVIQQIHLVAAHVVCGLVERAVFPHNQA